MPAKGDDPYAVEAARQIGARAPAGLLFFAACVVLSSTFEIARFPERTVWMLGFAAAFLALGAGCLLAVRWQPERSLPVLVVFVNLVGMGLNAYHAIVGAAVAMCLWTLTGLICSAAVFLRWGERNQLLASLGAVALYPLHLALTDGDVLTWAAGGAYLIVMVAMSVFGAGLYADYVRSGLRLASALSEREARLRSYVDLVPVGSAVIRPDGTFVEANDALGRVLGRARDALVDGNWFELPVPEDRAAVMALARRALAGAADAHLDDVRFVRGDGVTVHAAVDMRGLPGPHGVDDRVMVLVQDVTARIRADAERERLLAAELAARREAEAASQAKDDFLATLSHELRTPLSPVLLWSDLLRRQGAVRGDDARGLEAIARNAANLARLIDELLDVSRIQSGKLRLDPSPLELGVVLHEAVEVMRAAAEAKRIAITTAGEALDCRVLGDADRLRQVVWNLLSNAIKFTPTGGTVRVALERSGGYARVAVTDTGQGIDAGLLPFVFERFRQGDTSSTRRHGGLGIGLALVRELVELHGGRVAVESAGEGRGATFTVELPLLVEDRPHERRETAGTTSATLAGVRVLIVDDDPDSNDAVRSVLASAGADVVAAASAEEALARFARWVPDVVVSDIAMPGADGYALIRRLRAAGAAAGRVPVIALTAYSAAADRERALAAGFDAHVTKPLCSDELLHAVLAVQALAARAVE